MSIKIGRRVSRALFCGLAVGLYGGLGLYIMTEAINKLADQIVLNPVAMLLLGLGASIVSAIGIELSNDVFADEANSRESELKQT
jgi:Co/Zn/Cd efflux system component